MNVWIPAKEAEPLPGDHIRFILKTGFSDEGQILGVGLSHFVHSEYGEFPIYNLAFWQPIDHEYQTPAQRPGQVAYHLST